MKRIVNILLLTLCSLNLWAQDAVSKRNSEIVKEGTHLYHLEMASWHGSDLFVEKLKEKVGLMGGYLSYREADRTKCLIFTQGDKPSVLATISFDSSYSPQKAQFTEENRPFTAQEEELFTIRRVALERIKADTLFKHFNNATLNLVPVINNSSKKVYVLTGPQVHGVVLFGNDYLLTFTKTNTISSVKKLHQNLIPINTSAQDKASGNTIISTMHTHSAETGENLTATDVCTLLLYQKFTTWKQHHVLSPNHISIWDCASNNLLTLTKDAWLKMKDSQEQQEETKSK